jgi:hypothetical protein
MKDFIGKWANTLTGSLLLLFTLTLYLLVPSQIATIESVKLSLSPSFYPLLVIALTGIVSIIYLITSFLEERNNTSEPSVAAAGDKNRPFLSDEAKRTLTTMAIILVFIYLIEYLGFFIAAPIGLAAMMYLMGNRRILNYIFMVVLVPPVTYVVFEKLMGVILPRGVLY